MKKLYLSLLLICVLLLSSCGEKQTEFEKMLSNMENAESFRLDFTMDNVPLFGSITGYLLVDGDHQFISIFGFEEYNLSLDGKEYRLVNFNEEYYASELSSEDEDDIAENIYEDFSSEDFTKNEDGYYVSSVDVDDMTNIQVKIENDYITELKAEIVSDDYVIGVTFEFSEYNTTTVDFPEYTMFTSYETLIYNLVEVGYEYNETEIGFTFNEWSVDIEYIYGNDYYSIVSWGEEVLFYPEDLTIVIDGETQSLSTYLSSVFSPFDGQEVFDLLIELYNEK